MLDRHEIHIYLNGIYQNRYEVGKSVFNSAGLIKKWVEDWIANLSPLNSSEGGAAEYRKRYKGYFTIKRNYEENIFTEFSIS